MHQGEYIRKLLLAGILFLCLSKIPAPNTHIYSEVYAQELPKAQSEIKLKPQKKERPVKKAKPKKQVQPKKVEPKVVAETPPAPEPVVTGGKLEWMKAAGIDPSDYTYVDYIISKESGWNPDATNPTSGAHGLPQALPYSKTGCGWVDAVCQLQWATSYAVGRYGSWGGAYNFWVNNHWW